MNVAWMRYANADCGIVEEIKRQGEGVGLGVLEIKIIQIVQIFAKRY